MPRSRTLALTIMATLTASCGPDWGDGAGALSRALPKSEIIGCYRAGEGLPTLQIETDRITANGNTVYSGYDYRLGGRNSVPLLVVQPRMELHRQTDGTYVFKPWKQDLGDSFSYSVMRHPSVAILMVSNDAVEHRFRKVACG